MSFLNLMGDSLKPKEVNDALESIMTSQSSEPATVTASDVGYINTSSHLTATNVQSAIDETVTNINGIKFDTVASITAGENETLSEVIDRLRDNHFDDLTPFRQIKMDIDGTTNMIFTCARWTGTNVSVWVASKPTSETSMTIIVFSMSSTSVVVRKYVTSASGVTGTDISTATASGTISLQGLVFS